MDVNGVIYQYTAVKDPADDYTVTIRNSYSDGTGYVFSETDDWSGNPGSTINKLIPLPYVPLTDFGDGEIAETGIGSVIEPTVIYTYRLDPETYNQPTLPDLPELPTYDPLADRNVLDALEPTDLSVIESEEKESEEKDEEEEEDRLRTALTASDSAMMAGLSASQSAKMKAMTAATNINSYYQAQITGGVYKEVIVLQDKNIPDNRRMLRSLGQDKLHTRMVDQQWGR